VENASLVGLSRQMALRRELDVISNNVANMNTNGFKAEETAFSEYLSPKARDDTFLRPDRRLSFVEDKGTYTNFAGGGLHTTGEPTDVALDGKGFFVVETPDGVRYTRNGAFQINVRGALVTQDGHSVLSDAGPLTFAQTETGLTIGPDGAISTSEGQRGRLRVVRIDDIGSLEKVGSSTYRTDAEPTPITPETRVVQGAIERSNVKPITEIGRMVEVTRAYESLASLLDRQDDVRRSAIERLAEVPA
jgi:flagellar basal-body rod protein FlgF